MKLNNFQYFLKRRELGLRKPIGENDYLSEKFYKSFDKFEVVQRTQKLGNERKYGGVFNLEYNLDGRILVAACEEKSILLYDALNQKSIDVITEAHSNCVNCIKFLDTNTFASCSDDASVKLWDLRSLKKAMKNLHGHNNWVKNIEYSVNEKILVTSAFDGSIYTWDLKKDCEINQPFDTAFFLNGIMRIKLSSDGDKMIISTTNGYMIIIHNLNLETLAFDLKSFKPNLYRLMQLTEQNFPAGNIFNYLFDPNRKRNMIEFIDDFPNKAEMISSLSIHPHGWSVLSRNINGKESEDWTCVHDIQMKDPSEYGEHIYVDEQDDIPIEQSENHNNLTTTDLWVAHVTKERSSILPLEIGSLPPMSSMTSGLIGRNAYKSFLQHYPEYHNKIVKNLPRLTHYLQEKNVGEGYIKEVCFSPDGRTICSPYDKGIRILGFSQKAEELTYCLQDQPTELITLVEKNNYHKNSVVCCKFNPFHMQLASGCLGGDIIWYKPFI